jgi:hypothetical protein
MTCIEWCWWRPRCRCLITIVRDNCCSNNNASTVCCSFAGNMWDNNCGAATAGSTASVTRIHVASCSDAQVVQVVHVFLEDNVVVVEILALDLHIVDLHHTIALVCRNLTHGRQRTEATTGAQGETFDDCMGTRKCVPMRRHTVVP